MKQALLHSCMGSYVESPDQAGLAAAKALSRKVLRELLDEAPEDDRLVKDGTATGSPTLD